MKFFNTTKYRIIMLVVMVMLLQVLMPVVGDVVWAEEVDPPFKVTGEKIKDDMATISWEFTVDLNNKMETETYDVNFTLKEDVEKKPFEDNGTLIGWYSVSKDGEVTITINQELYKELESGLDAQEKLEDEVLGNAKDIQGTEGTNSATDPDEDGVEDLETLEEGRVDIENEEIEETPEKEPSLEGIIKVPGATEKPNTSLSGGSRLQNNESGNDLENIKDFQYEINLYLDSEEEPENNGDVIEIDDIQLLTYEVKFTIEDEFQFNNGDYLNLDIASLINLKGISLGEYEILGRINFKFDDGTEIDAAEYKVEDNILKITFDNVDRLNNKNNRIGYVELGFDVGKTEEEVEVIEKLELVGTETKTFYILRNHSDTNSITKNGAYDSVTDEITWTIDVNKDFNDLKKATLTDEIPAGLTVKEIKLYDLKITVNKGSTKITEENESDITSDNSIVTIDGENNLEIKLGDLNRMAKRIKITTAIDGSEGGDLTFNNKATLSSDDKADISDNYPLNFKRVTGISKSGKWGGSGNKITWTVEFRGDGSENSYDLIDTPSLPDNIGLVLVNESVKLNGSTSHSITVTEDNGQFKFTGIPSTKELQTLEYTTEVIYKTANFNDPDKSEDKYEITNSVNYNGNKIGDTVHITREKILSKDNGTVRGGANETYVDWNIDINKNNESWTNVEVWEYIPEGFEFVSAKIGNESIMEIIDGTDGNRSYKKIPIGNINQKTTVTVRTKLLNLDGFNESLVKNQAKIKWKPDTSGGIGIGIGDINENGYEDNVEGQFQKSRFTHTLSKSNTGINYKEQTASWKVEYTTYDTDIKRLVIVDELTDELTAGKGSNKYIKDSLELTLNGAKYGLREGDNQTTIGDNILSYNLKFDNERKFTLNINSGNINVYYNHLVLQYKTEFKLSEMDDSAQRIVLRNDVKVINSGQPLDEHSIENIKQDISKNGSKSVSKEPGENRVFNWTVKLNHKGKTISNGKIIVDELTGKQKYIEDSIKIYRATLDKDGNLNKKEDELLKNGPDKDYNMEFTKVEVDSEGNDILDPYHSGMDIKFNADLTTPIIIEYQTEAVGISEEYYENKISYNEQEYDDSIRYNEFNEYITKKLLNSRNGNVVKGDILKWKLVINESLSKIHDFELKDGMSEGLVFIKDSLKIYYGETITITEELVTNNGKTTIHLEKNSYNRYFLEEIKAPEGYAKLDEKIEIELRDAKEIEIEVRNSKETEVTGKKEWVNGPTPRPTIQLQLYRQIVGGEIEKVGEPVTLENGTTEYTWMELEATDKDGKEYKYTIDEMQKPENYGKSISADGRTITITNTYKSPKTEITGIKIWQGGPTPRPTIQLQLYRDDEPFCKPVELKDGVTSHTWEVDRTDNNGKEYKYTVDEVEVPKNYEKLDSVNKTEVVNRYVIPKTSVTGYKEWKGGSSRRPTIELQLYKSIDGPKEKVGDPVKLKDGETEYTWTDLDKANIKGKEYKYTVEKQHRYPVPLDFCRKLVIS